MPVSNEAVFQLMRSVGLDPADSEEGVTFGEFCTVMRAYKTSKHAQ
eukprot:COSAG01_NODE_717_length_14076_cov_20.354225_3_plen_46_part_00